MDVSDFSNVDASGKADGFESFLSTASTALAAGRRAGLARLELQPGGTVVDAGCGIGELLVDLARIVGPTGRVVGTDLSQEMVDRARRCVAAAGVTAEIHVGDAHDLPLDDGIADATRADRLLEHVEDPVRVVRELARVTRPGGVVCAIDPNHMQAELATDDPETWTVLRSCGIGSVRHPRAGIMLRGWFVDAGLTDIGVRAFPLELSWPVARVLLAIDSATGPAAADGSIDPDRVAAFIAEQEERHAERRSMVNSIAYFATGRVRS